MSKEMGVIVLGLLTVVVPFLGIPSPWRTGLLVLAGAALAVLGFYLRGEAVGRGMRHTGDFFVENDSEHDHAEKTPPTLG